LDETVSSEVNAMAIVAHEDNDESTLAVSIETNAHACSTPTCCGTPWMWGRAEYLLWWTDGMGVPPLVTTSLDGTLQDQAGVLGESGTSILFGDSGLNSSARSGGRFTLGMWFDPRSCRGLEVSYLALAEETGTFGASDADFAILARPFFNVQPTDETDAILPGRSDARLIVFDQIVEGSVDVDAKTGFQELEVLLRQAVYQGGACRLDFLVGYQFSYLNDELLIEESTESLDVDNVAVPVGTTIELFDLFDTSNKFHGAEFGLVFRERVCRWSLDAVMKIALGNTHSRAEIDGGTVTIVPDQEPNETLGGLLALPSNIGTYQRNRFTMIPELNLTLGYDITCGLRAAVGYTFIYWSDVARPGDLIDLDVNPSQFGGGDLEGNARPQFSWVTTDFWAQGLNLSLEYQF